MHHINRRELILGGTAIGLLGPGLAGHALAQAPSQATVVPGTLTLGTKLELNTLDPHFFNGFPQGSSHSLIFDALMTLDNSLRVQPGLATGYKLVSELVWEFTLRRDVKYHNGAAFTAADVVATYNRVPNVPNSPNLFSQFTKSIDRMEVVNDHVIRFHTKEPNPTLPADLSRVFIIPAALANATTADFNTGSAFCIGTGPYKVVEWVNGDRLVLEANPNYWGGKPAWGKVVEKVIKSDPTRIANLLSGQVDAIDEVPPGDIPRFREDARYAIYSGPSSVVHYIALDSDRDDSPFIGPKDGQPPLKGNPLKDKRVRRALSLAINRELMASRLMDGSVSPASQFMPSTFEGTSQKLKPHAFDPDQAKKLLAEAGYGEGFKITLHATNDRYPKDRDIAQAIGQTWTRLGLQVAIEAVPGTVFFGQASTQKYSAFIAQYGTEEALIGPRALIHTVDPARGMGTANRTKHSNPAIDAVIQKAAVEMDPAKRTALTQQALELTIEEQAFIPVFHPNWQFAARKDLVVESSPLRRFNALMLSQKKA
ncbi:MAG: ABC transporter substrate-binding protein [Ferrovibrio sp.]|nr:ABC transporter substrate-binding protein [Ferrovibrio sp.]